MRLEALCTREDVHQHSPFYGLIGKDAPCQRHRSFLALQSSRGGQRWKSRFRGRSSSRCFRSSCRLPRKHRQQKIQLSHASGIVDLLDEPLGLVTVDVNLGSNVVVCAEWNLLYGLVVSSNERLTGENLEEVVVSYYRGVVEGSRSTLIVSVVDQVASTEIECSKSSDGTSYTVTGDGEQKSSILDCLLGDGEIVGGLFGEHVEVVDSLCDHATLAVGDEVLNALVRVVDAVEGVALEDNDNLFHLGHFGDEPRLAVGFARDIKLLEDVETLGEGGRAGLAWVAVGRHGEVGVETGMVLLGGAASERAS